MQIRILPIIFLLATSCPFATSAANIADTAEQLAPGAHLHMPGIPAPYYQGGGSGTHIFTGGEAGYTSFTTKWGNTKFTRGGFAGGAEIGLKIIKSGGRDSKMGVLSFSLALTTYMPGGSYTDAQGNSHSSSMKLNATGLRMSYTGARFGRGGVAGFYWQLGASVDHVGTVKEETKEVTIHYNSFFAEPFAGCGFFAPVEFITRHTRKTVGGGVIYYGLMAGDILNNLAKDSGATMHGWTIALKSDIVF